MISSENTVLSVLKKGGHIRKAAFSGFWLVTPGIKRQQTILPKLVRRLVDENKIVEHSDGTCFGKTWWYPPMPEKE